MDSTVVHTHHRQVPSRDGQVVSKGHLSQDSNHRTGTGMVHRILKARTQVANKTSRTGVDRWVIVAPAVVVVELQARTFLVVRI